MVYGIGKKMMKTLLFVTNFLIFLIGALTFGISLWVTLDKNLVANIRNLAERARLQIPDELINNIAQYQASLWILVAVGGLLMVVGFLGCCGAGCESILLLTLFFVVILILAIVQIFALVYLQSDHEEINKGLHTMLEKFGEHEEPEVLKQFVPFQDALHCCGPTPETKEKFVAKELCKNPRENDCYNTIKDLIEKYSHQLMIAGIILLVIEAFAMLFSCVLCRAFRDSYPTYSLYA